MYCSGQGLCCLVLCVFVAVVVLFLIPITRREEAWAVGRHYLETGSSKNPTPQLAGHSDFSLVETGRDASHGRAHPAHPGEAGPAASCLTGLMDHQCVNCQDGSHLHQLPVHQFPKWVVREPVLLVINRCYVEVTYQNQMHLRNTVKCILLSAGLLGTLDLHM